MGYASKAGRARTSSRNPQVALYLVTNLVTGKTYVGVTNHVNLARRMSEHFYAAKKNVLNGAFHRAIRKYSRDCFSIKMLAVYASREAAYAAEVEYIKAHKPEYNSTIGGDGARGHMSTKKVVDTNRAIHSGNKYRLGKKHSNETKLLLSELGQKNIDNFKLYAKMGPKSLSKKVMCLDDGEIYESASEASRKYGVAKSAMIELCLGKRGRQTVGGMRFQYVEAA